jgi:hypothetical protein
VAFVAWSSWARAPLAAPSDTRVEEAYGVDVGVAADAATFSGLAQASLVSSEADDASAGLQIAGWRTRTRHQFAGVAQLAGWRSEADDFFGVAELGLASAQALHGRAVLQLGLVEAYATNLFAVAQVSLGRSDVDLFAGALQLAAAPRAGRFYGGAQIGVYNRAGTDAGAVGGFPGRGFVALAQIGGVNDDVRFGGFVELGALNLDDGDFEGALQLGAVNVLHRDFVGVAELGAWNHLDWSSFHGVVQIGAANVGARDVFAFAELGACNLVSRSFVGAFTLGLVNADGGFQGLLEVGALNAVGASAGRFLGAADDDYRWGWNSAFQGVAQVGVANLVGDHFYGAVQAALVANDVTASFGGALQLAGLRNAVDQDFRGVAQIAPLNDVRHDFSGLVQIGLVNTTGHALRGVQIALVNVAGELRGVQLGLLNISGRHGLPVSLLVNGGA